MKRTASLIVLLFAAGCVQTDAALRDRVRAQIASMRPTYDRGVATYPSPTDQLVRQRAWQQLETLVEPVAPTGVAK